MPLTIILHKKKPKTKSQERIMQNVMLKILNFENKLFFNRQTDDLNLRGKKINAVM